MAALVPDLVTDLVVVVIVAALAVVTVLEIRFLRARRRGVRPADEVLPDRAHNAFVTCEAIAKSLAREGVESPQAKALLEEAEMAIQRGNYRTGIDLLERAKEVLIAARTRAKQGDVAKGSAGAPDPGVSAPKELLERALKPEAVKARFSLKRAREALEASGGGGPAQELVEKAEGSLNDGDHAACLHYANEALKALGIKDAIGPAPGARPVERCLGCGAELPASDQVCPQCGAPRGALPDADLG
jgi:hypothetical protein